MGGKSHETELVTIKFGARVRHTPDGAEGRIVWANASAVKIEWNDGEKVTWRRSELASKGLVVVEEEEEQKAAAIQATASETEATPETEPATVLPPAEETTETALPTSVEPVPCPAAEQPTAPAAADPAHPAPAKTRTPRTAKADVSSDKKLSAIDAAAKVLGEQGKPMGCQELIGTMAAKGYWTSPGGKTPAATLYSALLREIDVKGDASRFVRVGRGMFALRPQA
jgi:hypothetical protein